MFQTLSSSSSSGNIRKRNITEVRAVVGSTMPQFTSFLPPSIPISGTQRSKEELLAKVDQQVISVLSANACSEFTRSIARGAAQVSAGATVDAVACLHRAPNAPGYSSELVLKAALDVGVKTANGMLNLSSLILTF